MQFSRRLPIPTETYELSLMIIPISPESSRIAAQRIGFPTLQRVSARRLFGRASVAQDDAAARYDVVLGAGIQRDVQAWIAREEITYLSSQANETKQPKIQSTAVIEDAAVQELIRVVLSIGELCGLLVQGITSPMAAQGESREVGKNFKRAIQERGKATRNSAARWRSPR